MKKNISISLLVVAAVAMFFVLSGCSSSAVKRKAEREKLMQTNKFTCDFVNAEMFPDTDVELNVQMAKKCDPEKPFSISQFRTPSENQGIMYCCSLSSKNDTAPMATEKAPAADGKKGKKEDTSLGL